jgi:transcriptional regulator with XRE-family HTH domain
MGMNAVSATFDHARIEDAVLAEEYYIALHEAYHNLRERFILCREAGLTQKAIAARLGWDKGVVSRRLHGRDNLTLKTIAAMATAMDSRLKLQVVGYDNLPSANYRYDDASDDDQTSDSRSPWSNLLAKPDTSGDPQDPSSTPPGPRVRVRPKSPKGRLLAA